MTVVGYAAGTVVIAVLGAIAAGDAARARISPGLVGVLLLAGTVWLLVGGGMNMLSGSLWMHVLGAAAGAGVPVLLIAGAEAAGRRWPIYPGDAMLLGAVGAILGVRALVWAVALGCGLALVHRVCIQTRRGRAVTAGYLPAGPGLALGAALVFGFVSAGMAAEKAAATPDGALIEAVELAPAGAPLPGALAQQEIVLETAGEVAFPDAVALLGDAAGIPVGIEERPSRIAGGGVSLSPPQAVSLGAGGSLGSVVERLARRSGYGWEWRHEKLVFFRYWDRQWVEERSLDVAAPVEPAPRPGLLERVFGFLVGDPPQKGGKEETAAPAPQAAASPGRDAQGRGDGEAAAGDAVAEAGLSADSRTEQVAKSAEVSAAVEAAAPRWEVRPGEQRTLRGVLEDWAGKAEWRVAWQADSDFSVGAEAVFEGEFLEAVDGLLSDPEVSRVLVARAYANRYLVVRDAGR